MIGTTSAIVPGRRGRRDRRVPLGHRGRALKGEGRPRSEASVKAAGRVPVGKRRALTAWWAMLPGKGRSVVAVRRMDKARVRATRLTVILRVRRGSPAQPEAVVAAKLTITLAIARPAPVARGRGGRRDVVEVREVREVRVVDRDPPAGNGAGRDLGAIAVATTIVATGCRRFVRWS